jgi:hypothetical protein
MVIDNLYIATSEIQIEELNSFLSNLDSNQLKKITVACELDDASAAMLIDYLKSTLE